MDQYSKTPLYLQNLKVTKGATNVFIKGVPNYIIHGELLKHYGCDKRTLSVMVEVNRNLYLKEGSNLKNQNFKALKMQMRSLEEKLIRS